MLLAVPCAAREFEQPYRISRTRCTTPRQVWPIEYYPVHSSDSAALKAQVSIALARSARVDGARSAAFRPHARGRRADPTHVPRPGPKHGVEPAEVGVRRAIIAAVELRL